MAALPIYNILAVPDSNVYIQTAYYQNMTGKSPVREEKVYLIYLKEEQAREDLTNDSFRKIGLAGVITDVKLRVLDKDYNPIPGLLAVGMIAGGLYGVDYPLLFNGNSHGRCLTWARQAAETIKNGES